MLVLGKLLPKLLQIMERALRFELTILTLVIGGGASGDDAAA
jgi:hypothetical protein